MRYTVNFADLLLEMDIILLSEEPDPELDYADIRLFAEYTDIRSQMAVTEDAVSRFAKDIERLFRENYRYDRVTDVRAELTDGRQYIRFEHDSAIDVRFSAKLIQNGTEAEFEKDIPTLSIEQLTDALDIYR
jgi:hypothetical protein